MKNKSLSTISASALISIMACSSVYSESLVTSENLSAAINQVPKVMAGSLIQQNDYSVLRARWASYFLGDKSIKFDQNLQNEVNKVNVESTALLANLIIDKKGLWDDLPLNGDKNRQGIQLYATYQRLFTLARAYKLPGGELENNPQLLEKLTESLTFLHQHFYHVGTAERGNWWQWQIGISRVVNNTLVILYEDVPKTLIHNYAETSRYFVPRPTHLSEGYGAPYSSAPLMFESTGGNRTDNAQVVLIRGILDENTDEISSAVESLSTIVPLVKSGDGFYKDGSFIQHKDLPYSGTYGQVMVEGLGMLMGLVANTQWQVTDPNLQKIYPLLLSSFAPLIVDGKMMDMVSGRAVSRTSGQNYIIGGAMLNAMLLYLPGAPQQYKSQLAEFLKSQLSSQIEAARKPSKLLNSYQLAQQLIKDQTITAQPKRVTHKQFPNMDRVVHHRVNWSFGLAMHSDRVGNYECINGENLKGWYSADGMTYLYNDKSNHFSEFWPLVDAYKLPGTTALQDQRELCSGQLSAQRNGRQRAMDWTGGAQLQQYGAVGMKFVNWNGDLSAKKSWFMFDNEIIALGSDIKNSGDTAAITTIENRKIATNVNIFVNNQKLTRESAIEGILESMSIQDDSNQTAMNYYSLDQQPIKVSQQCRIGNWSDIGNNSGEVEGCFVEATIEHKTGQVGSYAYVIVPEGLRDPVAKKAITIVANNSDVHAIEQNQLGIFAANFWDDSKAGIVTSHSAMSIMLKTDGDIIQISVSNPTRSWWDTKFELEGQYALLNSAATLTSDQTRVEISDGNKFSVELSDLDGGSYLFSVIKKENLIGTK